MPLTLYVPFFCGKTGYQQSLGFSRCEKNILKCEYTIRTTCPTLRSLSLRLSEYLFVCLPAQYVLICNFPFEFQLMNTLDPV